MGTVTQFPGMGLATVVDFAAEVRRRNVATVFEALANVPDLVAITLRRELGGRWWDIRIQSLYYAAKEPDADRHRPQLTSYLWDAVEAGIDEDAGDGCGLPTEIYRSVHFETAAEALADAEADLAKREVSRDD